MQDPLIEAQNKEWLASARQWYDERFDALDLLVGTHNTPFDTFRWAVALVETRAFGMAPPQDQGSGLANDHENDSRSVDDDDLLAVVVPLLDLANHEPRESCCDYHFDGMVSFDSRMSCARTVPWSKVWCQQ